MKSGLDYAWANPKPDPHCLLTAGARFIMRYLSHDPAKNLTRAELDAAIAAGLEVGVVWETTANRMLSGHPGGMADADEADAQVNTLGIPGIPVYFACDFDAAPADQAPINAYMDGVISVIGKPRAGFYGGYWPLKRVLDAGKATYAWQTTAWSGGNWDARAQIRQSESAMVCDTDVDWDIAMTEDFGQVPRPAASTSPAPITAPPGVWLDATITGRGTSGRLYSAYWDGQHWHEVPILWPVPTVP